MLSVERTWEMRYKWIFWELLNPWGSYVWKRTKFSTDVTSRLKFFTFHFWITTRKFFNELWTKQIARSKLNSDLQIRLYLVLFLENKDWKRPFNWLCNENHTPMIWQLFVCGSVIKLNLHGFSIINRLSMKQRKGHKMQLLLVVLKYSSS